MSAKPTFKDFVKKNFSRVLKEETKSSLGDRSKYVGSSDVGSCPYKVVREKLSPVEHSFEKQIVFQRGHIAETMVEKMITGLNYRKQVEVKGDINNFPLKSHIDFLIEGKNESIIIEVKTVSSPIKEPNESWVLQTQFQMGLLNNEIQDEDHKVRAIIFAIDVNTGWSEEFNQDFDDSLFLYSLNKAAHIADCLENEAKPKAVIQHYCGSCPFQNECPKQGGFADEVPEEIKEDISRLKEIKSLDKEKKLLEKKIKEFLVNVGINNYKHEGAEDLIVTLKEIESSRFNTAAFKKDHPDLYEEYTKVSQSIKMTVS